METVTAVAEETVALSPSQVCADLGLSIESSSPIGGVDGDWPHIAYQCRIVRNGRQVWAGPYKLGVGHIKTFDPWGTAKAMILTDDQKANIALMHRKPHVQLKNKATQADACAAVARIQKVTPNLPDVMNSLLLDGSCYFDHESFADWCGNLGYSDDSIKARGIYDACIETGRALSHAFKAPELVALREAFQNY